MKKRVLVVDDDAGLQELLEAVLELENYEVIAATNGQQALEILERITPDLILLDIMMPRMNGFTFMEYIRKHNLYQQIPIMILTASVRSVELIEQTGVDSYLVKPFDLQSFLDEVTRLLEEPRLIHTQVQA